MGWRHRLKWGKRLGYSLLIQTTNCKFMEEQKFRVQDYLSFGYLYLLVIGILKDSIYYGLLGINIIRFSNIVDVLLSPIAYLTENPLVILLFGAFLYFLNIQRRWHQKYQDKKWYRRIFNPKNKDRSSSKQPNRMTEIVLLCSMLAFFLLGTGIGEGITDKKRIKNGNLKMQDTIIFLDQSRTDAHFLGQNSTYLFYIREGEKKIATSPINGSIKVIYKK